MHTCTTRKQELRGYKLTKPRLEKEQVWFVQMFRKPDVLLTGAEPDVVFYCRRST